MKWLLEKVKKHKGNIAYFYECHGPLFFGLILAFIGFVFFFNFSIDIDILDKIFNLLITLTAITIGFIGVLLGIIATIKERPSIKKFWKVHKGTGRKTLKKYFMKSLHFGLGFIIYSIILLIILRISCITNAKLLMILQLIWCFLLGFSFACFYRVISFVMFILFAETDDSKEYENTERSLIDDERKEELRDKHKK